jgi:hypothetical protein
MVTFYTRLIIHIKSSSLNHLSNQTLHLQENGTSSIKRCAPTKLNQNFSLNEPSYHDYIYNQLYSLNRKSINTISKNCTKYYLNNSPTEVSINNIKIMDKKNNLLNSKKLCCCLLLPDNKKEYYTRRHSSVRKNSGANNVININFRKCNLSIPADNASLSSSLTFENKTEKINILNNNNNFNELNDNKVSTLKTKRVSYGDLGNRQRKYSKPRFSTFSLKKSIKLRNRSNSLYYAQNSVDQNFETFNYQSLRIKRNRKAARMLGKNNYISGYNNSKL